MNGKKCLKSGHHAEKDFSVHPKAFIFFDKGTGTRRFEVKADSNGGMPADVAVSLLVAHCLMRKQVPGDFTVMVTADDDLLVGLRQLANKLILACPVIETSIRITSREEGVLREVVQSFSNKEIAAKLNLTERTVKFHVSALLSKFSVDKRAGLILKAVDLLSVVKFPVEASAPRLVATKVQGIGGELDNSRERLAQINALERRSRG